MLLISVVIPLFNEESNFKVLVKRLIDALEPLGSSHNLDYEIIFVDDGSKDNTFNLVKEFSAKNSKVKFLSFARNFGHQIAVSAGIRAAQGDALVIMDADLQDPPEILPQFISKWQEGYDVVYAIRKKRKEGKLKRSCYWLFYRILSALAKIEIPVDSGDFCLMSRNVIDAINRLPERSRFIRGLRSWVGFRHIGIEYERQSRYSGEVKYSFSKLVKLALDGIIGFSYRPLQIITLLGIFTSLVAFILGCIFFLLAFFDVEILGKSPRDAPGFTTLTLCVLMLGGLQLISLGVLGEYVGRIFEEVKGRSLFVLRDASEDLRDIGL